MARKRKPSVVGTHHSGNNTQVEILLDHENMEFLANFNGDEYRHKEAYQLKRMIDEAVRKMNDVQWVAVIEMQFDGNKPANSYQPHLQTLATNIRLEINRRYVGKRLDGSFVSSDWRNDTDAKRLASAQAFHIGKWFDMTFPKAGPRWSNTDSTYVQYLPYTEHDWQQANAILERLNQIQNQVALLMQTPPLVSGFTNFNEPPLQWDVKDTAHSEASQDIYEVDEKWRVYVNGVDVPYTQHKWVKTASASLQAAMTILFKATGSAPLADLFCHEFESYLIGYGDGKPFTVLRKDVQDWVDLQRKTTPKDCNEKPV